MRRTAVIATIICLCLARASWAACDDDSIDTVSEDGDLIVLSSGDEYDVSPAYEATAALWMEGDDVLVCGNTIIDKDQGGKRIKVKPH